MIMEELLNSFVLSLSTPAWWATAMPVLLTIVMCGFLACVFWIHRLQKRLAIQNFEFSSEFARLREKKELFRAIFESADDGVIVLDPGVCTILDVNQKACESFGYSKEDLLSVSVFVATPPYSATELKKQLDRTAAGESQSFEKLVRHRSGNRVWLRVKMQKVQFGSGSRILIVVRDITNQKKTEKEISRLQTSLLHSQKMEVIGLLAGGIVHDLNTMYTIIIGCCELLARKLGADPSLRDISQSILKLTRKSAIVARKLLISNQNQMVSLEQLDVNRLIREFEPVLNQTLMEGIRKETVLADESLMVMADVCQLERVILNLIINARDAMGDSGVLTLVTRRVPMNEAEALGLSMKYTSGYVVIEVIDTGCGMSDEILRNVGKPFFTTKNDYGSGFGMTVVHQIIEQHGGRLIVVSEPEKGTTMQVFLPACNHGEISCQEASTPIPTS
ncbi:MAG: hypothetical protein GQF41_4497 [Candidatus Rifleibacterium amylolyticum]|nr:MAG: hypothetical protein GQF41_4497 [Candidatus Rifleibacterium amylolyticum]